MDGYLLHPLGECAGTAKEVLRCRSYNWWSGVEGAAQSAAEKAWYAMVLLGVYVKHHNCHEPRCLRWGHPDADGVVKCRFHRLRSMP